MRNIIEICWKDSCNHGGWHNERKQYTLSSCRTLGYLVKEDKETISIAQSIDETGNQDELINNVQVIPKSVIYKRRLLK